MKPLYFCTRWGSEYLPWASFCEKVKAAGYDGVETTLPLDNAEKTSILAELKKHGLKLIAVQWDTGTPDFDAHLTEYQMRLRSAATADPLFITSHTGKDFFSFEQNTLLLNAAKQVADETGVKIVHETHRGKFSFAAHVMKDYLNELPWLRLTLDISHWFTVAESYLADQQDTVEQALRHTDHIHARIGYVNGPQVSDPRSYEWAGAVEKHFTIWDKVKAMHERNGSEYLTFTTEFGPQPYMQLKPFSNEPVADQWEINEHMLNLLKKRYNSVSNS